MQFCQMYKGVLELAVMSLLKDGAQLDILGCLQGSEGFCRIEDCCVLRRALRDATNAFLAVLDHYTIENLVKPRRSLAHLFGIGGLDMKETGRWTAPRAL